MLKKEVIWREILFQAIENKQYSFTQKNLALKFGFSLSTVFNALKIPRSSGAIKVSGRNFRVVDKEKFLTIWGTHHRLEKEIIYSTHVEMPIKKIEGELPADVITTAYTAYRQKFNTAPADYGKIYVYAENLEDIKKRFPYKKGDPNLIVLKKDDYSRLYKDKITMAQLYVDLWNLKDWYAQDYLKALKEKI